MRQERVIWVVVKYNIYTYKINVVRMAIKGRPRQRILDQINDVLANSQEKLLATVENVCKKCSWRY